MSRLFLLKFPIISTVEKQQMTIFFKQQPIHCNLLLLFMLFTSPLPVHAQVSSKLFSIPVSEAGRILTTLFTSAGLEVHQTALDTGSIKISATNQEESWHILVQPHSALGVRIEVEQYKGPLSVTDKVQTLWEDIAAYQKKPESIPQAQEQVIPSPILSKIESVVCIRATIGNRNLQFSGFLIDNEGLILCTAHDLKVYEEVKVVFATGLEYLGDIIQIDMHRDLALIKIHATHESIISPAEGRNLLGMGEKIYSIGCPVSLRGTVYSGSINGPPRRTDDLPLWQVDMQIMPGSSGSPVFDATGTFVAMVKGRYRGTDRIGFLIPLETIIAFLDETKTL